MNMTLKKLSALLGVVAVIGVAGCADRLIPTAYAGILATVMPVAAMLVLIGASSSSSLLIVFALLFGAGMGVKTVVQATAAPEFLGIRDYGALQGILSTPVQIVQAASPFVAALLWQWSGGYELLTYVLLGCCAVSAITFGSAAWISRSNAFASQAGVM